jgi:predicted negative regulator of RcsB-dependent stress response
MKKFSNQRGFSVVAVVLIIVVLGVVGLVGYKVANHQKGVSTAAATSTATIVSAPSSIKSKADVQQAVNSLNTDQSDQQLDPNQFNSSISKLL